MSERLSCRSCGNALVDPRDCVMCHDFKTKYLVVEGVLAGDDDPDLVAAAEELVSLIRWNTKALRQQARRNKDYDPELGKQVQMLARSAQGLLDSARKLMEQGSDVMRSMGLKERLTLVKEWLDELPPVVRDRSVDFLQGKPVRLLESS